MKTIIVFLVKAELTVALHMGTAGEWWAARAARRLGKFSGDCSKGLK